MTTVRPDITCFMTKRGRKGLMEIEDAVHALYIAKGLKRCPTCGEDLTFE